MAWTIDQLQSFLAVVESHSFTAAGKALGKAQSVISNHVSGLENELGIELFSRSNRAAPILTEAGEKLIPGARAVLREAQRFSQQAISQSQADTELSVAIGVGLPVDAPSQALLDLQAKYPYLSTSLVICPYETALLRIKSGESHVAVVYNDHRPPQNFMETQWIGSMPQALVAASSHPLAARKGKIPMQELLKYRQVVLEYTGLDINALIFSPIICKTNNLTSAASLISRGCGWGLLPEPFLNSLNDARSNTLGYASNLVKLSAMGIDFPEIGVLMIWNHAFQHSDIIAELRKNIATILQRSFVLAQKPAEH